MSREPRAKQREFLKLDRPFFDKSLVRRFSSFEKPRHRPVISKSPIYQQKATYVDFLLSKNFIFGPALYRAGPPLHNPNRLYQAVGPDARLPWAVIGTVSQLTSG